jgi:hypothetical protein
VDTLLAHSIARAILLIGDTKLPTLLTSSKGRRVAGAVALHQGRAEPQWHRASRDNSGSRAASSAVASRVASATDTRIDGQGHPHGLRQGEAAIGLFIGVVTFSALGF